MCAQAANHELVAGEDRYLPTLVFKLARELRTTIERELAEQGITMQQAVLIILTHRHGGHGVSRLAGPMGTDTAGLTRLVDRLEAKGLVVRESSPQDRRAIVVRLTAAGEALVPDLVAAFRRADDQLVGCLPEHELAHVRGMLLTLHENLRRPPGEAGRP